MRPYFNDSRMTKVPVGLHFPNLSDILFYKRRKSMQTYDISLSISADLPVWPGDPRVVLERISKIEDGDSSNVTRIEMSAHTGTHVDAPYHFLGGDAPTVDELSLKVLTGRAYVLHIPDPVERITQPVLEAAKIPPRTRRLLIKTRNSELWKRQEKEFLEDYVALEGEAAQYLVDRGVKLVGVDYLSVAPYDATHLTHQILLQAGIVIVEGLNLSAVAQGRYTLYCLPLKLAGTDGAPARAILTGV
jgi:arylformamidase